MNDQECKEIAQRLHSARRDRAAIEQLSSSLSFDTETAYRIQHEGIALRVKDGETLSGYKMGLTSEKKRQQMKLFDPVFGCLTKEMQIHGTHFDRAELIHPKIEPEIAMKLSGKVDADMKLEEIFEKVASFHLAFEVLDSRYSRFEYFSLQDVIADNSSSSHYFIGPAIDAKDLRVDLAEMKVDFWAKDKLLSQGQGKDVSGHPLESLRQLAQLLDQYSPQELKEGDLVLTGALTEAFAMTEAHTVKLSAEELGEITLEFN